MPRLFQRAPATGHRVLVVDDDVQLLRSTHALVAREGHEVRSADGADAAVEAVRAWKPHLVLLDYYMPGRTGVDVVREVRTFDTTVQILLVTGYASEQPARRMLAEHDIQGYHDKADGPQRLLVQIDAALKHWTALARLERQQRYLRRIVESAPVVTRLQPLPDLFRDALTHLGALLGDVDGIVVTANSGLFVLDQARRRLSIRAGTGRYEQISDDDDLPSEIERVVQDALGWSAPQVHPLGYAVVPLRTRAGDRGCMILDARDLPDDAVEPCAIYAQQVVQAIENVILYERATVDPLTGIHNRGYVLQRLDETLRLGLRRSCPTSVLLLDVDHFKSVNDRYGHAAGDLLLRALGDLLHATCRTTDVVGRYGGEEFLVVLPDTDEAGAATLAERIRRAVAALALDFEGQRLEVTASVGVAEVVHAAEAADALVARADDALYAAKRAGRNQFRIAASPMPRSVGVA